MWQARRMRSYQSFYYTVLSFWSLFFPSPIFQRVVKNFYTICFYTFFSFFFNLVLNIFLHSQNCFLTFGGILSNFGGSQQSKNEFSECSVLPKLLWSLQMVKNNFWTVKGYLNKTWINVLSKALKTRILKK